MKKTAIILSALLIGAVTGIQAQTDKSPVKSKGFVAMDKQGILNPTSLNAVRWAIMTS